MSILSTSKSLVEYYNVLHIPTKVNKDIRIDVEADSDGEVEKVVSIELHESNLSNGNLIVTDLTEFIEEFDLWESVLDKIDWRERYYQSKKKSRLNNASRINNPFRRGCCVFHVCFIRGGHIRKGTNQKIKSK